MSMLLKNLDQFSACSYNSLIMIIVLSLHHHTRFLLYTRSMLRVILCPSVVNQNGKKNTVFKVGDKHLNEATLEKRLNYRIKGWGLRETLISRVVTS